MALRSRICRGIASSGTTAAESSGGSSALSGDVASLARRVINGDYGNGEERKRRLGSNYAAVQRRVNQMLS